MIAGYIKRNMILKEVSREQLERTYQYDKESNTAVYNYDFRREVGLCHGIVELNDFIEKHPEVKECKEKESPMFHTKTIKFFLSLNENDYIIFKREWLSYFLHQPDEMTEYLSGTIQLFNISDLYLCDTEKYINAYEYYSTI